MTKGDAVMQTINVRQSDILWQFYTKAFTAEGKAIEPPKNLCRYVETALVGFGFWLQREVRLLNLWLAFLATVAVFTGMTFIDTAASGFWIVSFVAVLTGIAMVAILTAGIIVSLIRLKGWMMVHAPWVMGFVIFSFVGVGAFFVVQQIYTNGLPTEFFWFLVFMKWILYAYVSILILRFVFIPLLKQLPDQYIDQLIAAFEKLEPGINRLAGYAQKIHSLTMTLVHFGAAKKRQVCLPVNPPVDFNVEPKV